MPETLSNAALPPEGMSIPGGGASLRRTAALGLSLLVHAGLLLAPCLLPRPSGKSGFEAVATVNIDLAPAAVSARPRERVPESRPAPHPRPRTHKRVRRPPSHRPPSARRSPAVPRRLPPRVGPALGGVVVQPPARARPPASPRGASPALAGRPVLDTKSLEVAYLSRLQEAIAGVQRYPRVARRRGEQGRVVLTLVIEADGRFSQVALRHGSGHRRLDRAALRAVRRLGHADPLPPGLGRSRWRIEVPLAFRLR